LVRIKKAIIAIERFIVYRILHADDTPHRLALGIALGIFVGSTPTIGLQMIIVLLLASLFHANKVVGLPIVWFTNPFTIMPIYYVNYLIGKWILRLFGVASSKSFEQIRSALHSLNEAKTHFFEWYFWKNLAFAVIDISVELWVGCLAVGIVGGLVFYALSYYGIVWYRAHSPRSRRRKRMLDYRKALKAQTEPTAEEIDQQTDLLPK